jgi:acyl-coenzyme A synthetase/AMP-(fatty) acid ligase
MDLDQGLPCPDVDVANGLAAIMFSSGTTGVPKAIPNTHAMVWDSFRLTEAADK